MDGNHLTHGIGAVFDVSPECHVRGFSRRVDSLDGCGQTNAFKNSRDTWGYE
jgi:hypothetical protein